MLPKELLDAKKVKGRIYPKFAESDRDVQLAERVIEIFRSGLGKKYGQVMRALKKLESAENYRKVRGFARVLENHCIEKACRYSDTGLDPHAVRMFLFERGFVTSRAERDRIIAYASRYFNVDPQEIERAMYADREEELVISKVDEMDADRLIKMYNLSLLQTALFNSTVMRFEIEGNYKPVFRAVKFFGLMYEIKEAGKRVEVEVTGPASLVKMVRKYGVSMAKVIPHVISAKKWRINAKILENDRLYRFELDSSSKHLCPELKSDVKYDSSFEAEFFRRIRNLGYLVEREPGVIDAGGRAFIPDFAIWKDGWSEKVYVEIAGFWTEDYLKRKVEKIVSSNVPLVVVAREEFGETGIGDMPEVVLFSRKIDYGEVVKAVNRLARKYGNVRAGKAECAEKGVEGGKADEKVDRLKAKISERKPESLEELKSMVEEEGLKFDEAALEKLGIRVVWKGLNCVIKYKF